MEKTIKTKNKVRVGCRKCRVMDEIYFVKVRPAEDSYYRCAKCGYATPDEESFLFIGNDTMYEESEA